MVNACLRAVSRIQQRMPHAFCCGWLLALMLLSASAQGRDSGSSVLIWPTLLEIQADQNATALWLENRGSRPAQMQVRVFAWTQPDGENQYKEQHELVATPPMLTVAPGRRQMIRLSRARAAPADIEEAYRVVVDEIPDATAATQGVGVRFQLRYSLPLFVQASEHTHTRHSSGRDDAPQPRLTWSLLREGDDLWLRMDNAGRIRARLTNVEFEGGTHSMGDGLFGYVLARSRARWRLPGHLNAEVRLFASVNGGPRAPVPAAE